MGLTLKFHRIAQGVEGPTLESTEDPTQESTQNGDEAVEGRQMVMAPACTLATEEILAPPVKSSPPGTPKFPSQ